MSFAARSLARPLLSVARSAPSASRTYVLRAAASPSIRSSSLLSSSLRSRSPASAILRRTYASGLAHDDIKDRVYEVLKSFEKVDTAKITPTSSFTNDLGLDSLDAVEVVMAIEEEFAIEIPDEEADKITTVGQAIDYISKTPEAH